MYELLPEPDGHVERSDTIAQPDMWEQLPGENTMWYERFHTYLLLGPTRSVPQVIREFGASPNSTTIWYQYSRRFKWRERASAWDEMQRKMEREHLEEARKKAKERRIAIIDTVFDHLELALKTDLDEDVLKWNTLPGVLKAVIGENRTEFEGKGVEERTEIQVSVANDPQQLLKARVLQIRQRLSNETPDINTQAETDVASEDTVEATSHGIE